LSLKAPCSTYVQGTQLTPAGQQALLCLGGGAVITLASLVNPRCSIGSWHSGSRTKSMSIIQINFFYFVCILL